MLPIATKGMQMNHIYAPGPGDLGADPAEDRDVREIELTLGDERVPVYYVAGRQPEDVTVVAAGSFNAPRDCWSAWQLESWESSICRHRRAEYEREAA